MRTKCIILSLLPVVNFVTGNIFNDTDFLRDWKIISDAAFRQFSLTCAVSNTYLLLV